MFKIPVMLEIEPILVSVTIAKKLVIWFAVQIDWLVYIWSKHWTVTLFSPKHFKNGFANTGVRILELTEIRACKNNGSFKRNQCCKIFLTNLP